ncbi:MAG: hypothetical protein JXR86_18050 [Spirochaetales bacterium]|nr:hypothetical protein [Spirochaetales bacterium]
MGLRSFAALTLPLFILSCTLSEPDISEAVEEEPEPVEYPSEYIGDFNSSSDIPVSLSVLEKTGITELQTGYSSEDSETGSGSLFIKGTTIPGGGSFKIKLADTAIVIESGAALSFRVKNKTGGTSLTLSATVSSGTGLESMSFIADRSALGLTPGSRQNPEGQWIYVSADLSQLVGYTLKDVTMLFDNRYNYQTPDYEILMDSVYVGNRAPAAPQGINPIEYMYNNSGFVLQSPTGDIQKFHSDPSASTFRYVKNPYDGWRWEKYRYDGQYIWLERDTTWPEMDNGGFRAYDALPWGSMKLAPYHNWLPGEVLNFDTWIRGFNFTPPDYTTVDNIMTADTRWPGQRQLIYHNAALDTEQYFGADSELGVIDVIVIETKVRPLIPFRPTKVERHWYAKNYGWIRWQHWTNETEDPDFRNILAASPIYDAWNVRFMYKESPDSGPDFQDVCPDYEPEL